MSITSNSNLKKSQSEPVRMLSILTNCLNTNGDHFHYEGHFHYDPVQYRKPRHNLYEGNGQEGSRRDVEDVEIITYKDLKASTGGTLNLVELRKLL
jgi:hypothetical protein